MSDFDFLKITMAAPRKAEITVYEYIGPKNWDGKGVDAADVKKNLDALGEIDEITLRINSPGGNAYHGLAIYNLLSTHKAKKTVYVDGVAASAASIIAMCGDEVVMNSGSLLMIHEASLMAWGKKADLENGIKLLDAVNASAVKIYQQKTGLSEAEIWKLLKAETWFTDEQAVEKKFANRINQNVKAVAATLDPQQLSNAPDWVKERFSAPTQGASQQEPSMTDATTSPAAPAATSPAPASGTAPQAATAPAQTPATPAAAPAPPAASAQAPAAGASAEPVAGTVEDPVAVERERCSTINALCAQAGHPELAAKMLEDPHCSVEKAKTQLFSQLCNERAPTGDGGGSTMGQEKDPTAAFKKEYAEQKEMYAEMGVSEEDYVESRLVDTGEKKLVSGGAKKE